MRRRSKAKRRLLRVLLIALGLALGLILAGVGFELSLPSVANAPARVAAIVRAHDGELGHGSLPPRLGEAIVAVEDEHFYSNAFLNVFDGIARAALASLHTSGDPGGSTIAQQLAKQLYPEPSGFWSTLDHIGLGVKLALSYSKPEILLMYVNSIYFGNGYWGYVSAARGYFGIDPNKLSWAEAALLAGLPEAPSAYDPLEHLALAKARQRHVLNQLIVNHYLSKELANTAYEAPLPLRHQ